MYRVRRSRYRRVFFWLSLKAVVAFLFRFGYWDLGPGTFSGGLGSGSGPTVGIFWEPHCRGMEYWNHAIISPGGFGIGFSRGDRGWQFGGGPF